MWPRAWLARRPAVWPHAPVLPTTAAWPGVPLLWTAVLWPRAVGSAGEFPDGAGLPPCSPGSCWAPVSVWAFRRCPLWPVMVWRMSVRDSACAMSPYRSLLSAGRCRDCVVRSSGRRPGRPVAWCVSSRRWPREFRSARLPGRVPSRRDSSGSWPAKARVSVSRDCVPLGSDLPGSGPVRVPVRASSVCRRRLRDGRRWSCSVGWLSACSEFRGPQRRRRLRKPGFPRWPVVRAWAVPVFRESPCAGRLWARAAGTSPCCGIRGPVSPCCGSPCRLRRRRHCRAARAAERRTVWPGAAGFRIARFRPWATCHRAGPARRVSRRCPVRAAVLRVVRRLPAPMVLGRVSLRRPAWAAGLRRRLRQAAT